MNRLFILLIVFISLAIGSCQKIITNENQLNEDQKELIIDEVLQSTILDDLLQDIDIYSEFGEILTKSAEIEGGCPKVTIERPGSQPFWPRTVTLDFGEGCEKFGKIKSGIMVIEKSGPWMETGAIRKVTFVNYKVDDVSISGVKELVNTTEDEGNPSFEIRAELTLSYVNKDGKEVVVKREVDKKQEWIAGYRLFDGPKQILLTGKSEITKTKGDVEKTIKKKFNDILIVSGCRFPQSGVSEFEVNTFDDQKLKFTLDYATEGASGEKCKENCDCMATLGSDDKSEDIDLSDRWWKKTKEKNTDD